MMAIDIILVTGVEKCHKEMAIFNGHAKTEI